MKNSYFNKIILDVYKIKKIKNIKTGPQIWNEGWNN